MGDLKVGDLVTVEKFNKGDNVSVTGVSKGKGFQGVIKRHKFAGGPASHGSMFYRAPGSIGASSYPSRVWKNQRMPGHMGSERVTAKKSYSSGHQTRPEYSDDQRRNSGSLRHLCDDKEGKLICLRLR